MTINQPISHANRRALPRSLIARRPNRNAQDFKFVIGDLVRLIATGNSALIVSRTETANCLDEYAIEFTDCDRTPAEVFESDIEAITPVPDHANAPIRQRRVFDFQWMFQVGQRIHFYEAPGVILSRHPTAKGRQFYNICIDDPGEDRPFRWVFGDNLTARKLDCSDSSFPELA